MKQVSEIPSTSDAALYGKGVFTTIAIARGEPVLWDRHVARLATNAAATGITMPSADSLLRGLQAKLIEATMTDGRARVTLFDTSGPRLWIDGRAGETAVGFVVGPHRDLTDPFRLKHSPFLVNSRSPVAGVKSCNYLENLMALNDARNDGFDEALRLNERGEVTSAACANVFWIRGGRIFTPSLETACLAGTTRGFIVENFVVEEVLAGIEDLKKADAILLTSAGIGARRAVFEEVTIRPNELADAIVGAVNRLFGFVPAA